MNKIFATTLLFSTVCVGPVFAQTTTLPPATTPPAAAMAPAATTNGVNTVAAAPVAGANSFTMAQAQTRLKDRGFSQVSELVKDDKSVWRGHAMKDGKTVGVAVDYQGNITTD
jgi:putative membrane protein